MMMASPVRLGTVIGKLEDDFALPEFDTHVIRKVLRLESDANDPVPLTDDQIEEDIQDYLEFLREHKRQPGRNLVPKVQIDRIWHIHMIQTEQYAQVCNEYLGYFLHHASMICGAGMEKVLPWHHRQ